MKIKLSFFFLLFTFFTNFKITNTKVPQEDICSHCSCKIEEYRKQIKELENLLSIYRKENVSLTEKLYHGLESAAKEITSAYEKYSSHLLKCTSRR